MEKIPQSSSLLVTDITSTIKDKNASIDPAMTQTFADLRSVGVATTFVTTKYEPEIDVAAVIGKDMPYGVLGGAVIKKGTDILARGHFYEAAMQTNENDDEAFKRHERELSDLGILTAGLLGFADESIYEKVMAVDARNNQITLTAGKIHPDVAVNVLKTFDAAALFAKPKDPAVLKHKEKDELQRFGSVSYARTKADHLIVNPKGWNKEHAVRVIAKELGVINDKDTLDLSHIHVVGDEDDAPDLLKHSHPFGSKTMVTEKPKDQFELYKDDPTFQTVKTPQDLQQKLAGWVQYIKKTVNNIKQ